MAVYCVSSLVCYCIGKNYIGDEGAKFIVEGVKKSKTLKKLYVQQNQFTTKAIKRLRKACRTGVFKVQFFPNIVTKY
eukprot:m.185198 g.185198  ORF g.185198 m.185198 type:complete len:77 (-) comp32222_c1_seq3:159-389(-)